MTLAVMATASVDGWAGDNLSVSIQDISPAATIKVNDKDVTQGTLQLWYTVTAFSFTPGFFGTFRIDMKDVHLSGPLNAVYPAPLTLTQNGSPNLTLTPAPSILSVTGLTWTDHSIVTIGIPSGVPNTDGTDLVGNLRLNIPASNRVAGPATVQVHLRLVHPTFCLKVYNFMADAGAETLYGDAFRLDVRLKNDEVSSASPGTSSSNILVANVCGEQKAVDIGAILDPVWAVIGAQGVKLYSATGDITLTNYDNNLFGEPRVNGTNVCFQNAAIVAGQTVLLNIKVTLQSKLAESAIGVSPFSFEGSITQGATSCKGNLEPLANPNPVSANLPFTTTRIGKGSNASSE